MDIKKIKKVKAVDKTVQFAFLYDAYKDGGSEPIFSGEGRVPLNNCEGKIREGDIIEVDMSRESLWNVDLEKGVLGKNSLFGYGVNIYKYVRTLSENEVKSLRGQGVKFKQ